MSTQTTFFKISQINQSRINIKLNRYSLLDGSAKTLVQQVNDGSIIKRFDKTPLPKASTDVVCPHFLELKWAYGCPFDCAWCYLKGTLRFQGMTPTVKDIKKIELHTKTFLNEVRTPEILNTGELADSLMKENGNNPFSKFIIPLFEAQRRHKVLFVTKSDNIRNLLAIRSHKQAIVSFSLNADQVAKKWEKKAPSVTRRINAAKKLSLSGYQVRVRIDPMVPVLNWQKHYTQLVDQIFANFIPERITLGSLRGLQSTINSSTDKSWVKYLIETSSWGKKVDFNLRYWMYLAIMSYLKKKYHYKRVALCKETIAMWKKLRMDYKKINCNCIL